jgi:hypothetical protein
MKTLRYTRVSTIRATVFLQENCVAEDVPFRASEDFFSSPHGDIRSHDSNFTKVNPTFVQTDTSGYLALYHEELLDHGFEIDDGMVFRDCDVTWIYVVDCEVEDSVTNFEFMKSIEGGYADLVGGGNLLLDVKDLDFYENVVEWDVKDHRPIGAIPLQRQPRFCPGCGFKIAEGYAKFCHGCGRAQ